MFQLVRQKLQYPRGGMGPWRPRSNEIGGPCAFSSKHVSITFQNFEVDTGAHKSGAFTSNASMYKRMLIYGYTQPRSYQ